MANISAIVGMSGAAKTLCMSNFAWKDWFQGKKIYSNYYLQFDGQDMPFKEREKEGLLNFTPLYHPEDLMKIKKQSNVAIYLDEIDAFGADADTMKGGADAYDYRSESAVITEKFFKKRLRKSHGLLKYSVQQLAMAPKRVREETEFVYTPRVVRWRKTGDPVHPVAPLHIVLREQKKILAGGNIDSYRDTGKIQLLGHPLHKGINFVTPDMLRIYDTDADIFYKGKDKTTDVDRFINPESDHDLYLKCNKWFDKCMIEKLKDSGRHAAWKGDIMVTPPGKAPIILDATGASERKEGQPIKRLETRYKWKEFGEMLDIDELMGSTHYIAYYDERQTAKKVVKDWFVFPLEEVKHKVKRGKPTRITVSKVSKQPLKEFASTFL